MAPLLQTPAVLPSNEKLHYAEAHIIDFHWLKKGQNATEEEQRQCKAAFDAAAPTGLLHVVNHGLDPELFQTLRAVTHTYMTTTSMDEKDAGVIQSGTNCFDGYKPRTEDEKARGVLPVIEEYNYDYLNGKPESRPEVIKENDHIIREIFDFYHNELTPLLLDGIDDYLDFAKGTLRQLHQESSEVAHLLYYRPFWFKDNTKKRAFYCGHTDIGSMTYLYSNPIASLQVYGAQGWEYVAYIPNSILVNMGDAMHFISRGVMNATLHRIIRPRPEHEEYPRTALIYFVHPNHDSMTASVNHFQNLRIKHTNDTKECPGCPIDATGLNRVISTISAMKEDMYLRPVDEASFNASRRGELVSSPRFFRIDYEALAIREFYN